METDGLVKELSSNYSNMKILFITIGFAPYTFSESLCNSKLVLAMRQNGWDVDVISRIDNGTNYATEWSEPWTQLKDTTYHVDYPLGNKITRTLDVIKSAINMENFLIEGIRWASHAYELAYKLCKQKQYDVILTRSPSDIAHIVGYKLSKKTGIKWITNWNDPANTLWPFPYKHHFSATEYAKARKYETMCLLNADAITYPAETLGHIFKKEYPFLNNKLCVAIPHIGLVEGVLKEQKYVKNEVFSICHSGNLSIERNPENTFKAIRELIDEHNIQLIFDIMGYENEFTQQLISKYQLTGIVKFIGSHPYVDAMNILPQYDVLVMIEAILDFGLFFPSKFVDYAQSQRPILAISPAKGYIAQELRKNGGGVAADNTCEQKIKVVLWDMYQKWRSNTLQSIYNTDNLSANYSTKKVIDQYSCLFEQLNIYK